MKLKGINLKTLRVTLMTSNGGSQLPPPRTQVSNYVACWWENGLGFVKDDYPLLLLSIMRHRYTSKRQKRFQAQSGCV